MVPVLNEQSRSATFWTNSIVFLNWNFPGASMTYGGTYLAAFAIVVMTSGCAPLPVHCAPPFHMMASAEMIFGRNIGDRPGVSELAFAEFVAQEITPRFPDGLTVVDGNGQWRDHVHGSNVRERAKVVLMTFADDAQKRTDLIAIANSYKRKFAQQSVLTQVRNACVSF
jgi:hypothetical protein